MTGDESPSTRTLNASKVRVQGKRRSLIESSGFVGEAAVCLVLSTRAEQRAVATLKRHIIDGWLKRQRHVVFVALDSRVATSYLGHSPLIRVVDGQSSPLGWTGENELARKLNPWATLTNGESHDALRLYQSLEALDVSSLKEPLLVVDSLSRVGLRCSDQLMAQLVKLLERSEKWKGVVCFVPTDVLVATTHLCYAASTLLYVNTLKADELDDQYECVFVRKRAIASGGKVGREVERVRLERGGRLEVIRRERRKHVASDGANEIARRPHDPVKAATFDMTLTESERAARDSIVLPYKHQGTATTIPASSMVQSEAAATLNDAAAASLGTSDEEDDFDDRFTSEEEADEDDLGDFDSDDPDDDLDF